MDGKNIPEISESRDLHGNIVLFAKGLAMGAADAVPGVSGGTIAFISGIYGELLAAIRSVGPTLIRLIVAGRFRDAWRHLNGSFLVVLLAGILTSLVVFSRLILFCLTRWPVLVWAFFFGLVVASAVVVLRKIQRFSAATILAAVSGLALGYVITVMVPAATPEHALAIFLSGVVAICAMILPGISGSFILVLLSKYEFMVTALQSVNIPVILVFCAGCASGLLSFSHLLHWTLKRYHDITVSFLTGVMVGSLNKVWPWKLVTSTYLTSHGDIRPLTEQNVWPAAYGASTGQPDYLVLALTLAVAGFALVYVLETRFAKTE